MTTITYFHRVAAAIRLCCYSYEVCAVQPAAAAAAATAARSADANAHQEATAAAAQSRGATATSSSVSRIVYYPQGPLVPLPSSVSPLAYAAVFEVLGAFFRSALKAADRAAAAAAARGANAASCTAAGAAALQLLWPPHPRELHRGLLWRLEALHAINASVAFCLPLICRPRLPHVCCSSRVPALEAPLSATASTVASAAVHPAASAMQQQVQQQQQWVFGPIVTEPGRPLEIACSWGLMGGNHCGMGVASSVGPRVHALESLIGGLRGLLLPSLRAFALRASSIWRVRILERRRGGGAFCPEDRLLSSPTVAQQLASGAAAAPRELLLQRNWGAISSLLALRGLYPKGPEPQEQEIVCPRVGGVSMSLGRTIDRSAAAAAADVPAAANSGGSGEDNLCLPSEQQFMQSLVHQLSLQLLRVSPAALIARERCFSVELRGEGAQDLGGPYAEALSAFCDDLKTSCLLTPSSNSRAGVGEGRDFCSPNPLLRDLLLPATAAHTSHKQQQDPARYWHDDAALGVWGPVSLHQQTPSVPSLLSSAPPMLLSNPWSLAAGAAPTAPGKPLLLLQQQLQLQRRAYAQLASCWGEGDEDDTWVPSNLLLRFLGPHGFTMYGQRVVRALQSLGLLMGCAILSLSPLNLSLTPATWVLLLGEQPKPQLLLQQDLLAAKHLRRLQAPIAAAAAAAAGATPAVAATATASATPAVAAAAPGGGESAAGAERSEDSSVDSAAAKAAAAAAEAAAKAAAAAGDCEEEAREEAAAAVYALLQRGACTDDSAGRQMPLVVGGQTLSLRPQDLPVLLDIETQAKVNAAVTGVADVPFAVAFVPAASAVAAACVNYAVFA